MYRTFMIASLTLFSAVAAFAAPRNSDVSTSSSTNEEVVVNLSDEQGAGQELTQPVKEKDSGCGCGSKPKKVKK